MEMTVDQQTESILSTFPLIVGSDGGSVVSHRNADRVWPVAGDAFGPEQAPPAM